MDGQSYGEIALLVICVAVAGLASATETAMTSIGRLRVRHLVDEGSQAAAVLERLQQDPNRFLSTVLVVNTLALILASFATTLLSVRYMPPSFGFLGDLLVSLGLSVFLLIFAEVTPKTIAIRRAETLALWAAGPVDALARLLRPVLWFITLVSRAITGGRAARAPYLTEQELMTLLHVSEEQGVIEEEEREMIHGIIEIGDKLVREVMVPRTDITALPRGCSRDEVVRVFREHGHTRLPVYEGDLDHIAGLVNVKDLVGVGTADDGKPIAPLLRHAAVVPETKRVPELLKQFQRQQTQCAIVVDEYGGTAGLVTIEDLLEEIVGEIRDEYDVESEPIVDEGHGRFLFSGKVDIDEVTQRLGVPIEREGFETVGGYVMAHVGRVPAIGEQFEADGLVVEVVDAERRRINKVRIRRHEVSEPAGEKAG